MITYSELIKTLIIDPIAVADELWVFTHLVSPAMAAAAAIHGHFVDVRF